MGTKTWLRDALASWGLRDIFAGSKPKRVDLVLDVFWLDGNGRILVGSVAQSDGEYCFSYHSDFCAGEDSFAVIPAFPQLGKVYRSESIWPFLRVRLPPLDRDDARKMLKKHGIDPHKPEDRLRLIEVLGGKSPVSPFEFEMSA